MRQVPNIGEVGFPKLEGFLKHEYKDGIGLSVSLKQHRFDKVYFRRLAGEDRSLVLTAFR